ncbi:MAG TPA: aspartate/glutamate racemase family protein, partial [Candidatus Nitrosotenuis sp.]|nr:aspartate/glutamate racemase family protein [Candidatus Nitrosotenuis sp.]
MPRIHPPGGAVSWPESEGTLGVVGVAPWATLDFCRAFYSLIPAQKDWHYPRVIIDSNPKIPSRGRHLELGEADPSPAIRATIAELAAQGATVAVVPCNTVHLLYDRWAPGAPIPVPSILDAVVERCREISVQRAAVLASRSAQARGLYDAKMRAAGLEPVPLAADENEFVFALIEAVKKTGGVSGEQRAGLGELFHSLAR